MQKTMWYTNARAHHKTSVPTFTTNDHYGVIFVANTILEINILTLLVWSHYEPDQSGKGRMLIAQFVLATKIAFSYAMLVQYELEN